MDIQEPVRIRYMARPISYNPDEVLSKAVHVFWEKGYQSSSVKDLVKATGLKPGSLYLLHRNKRELFHASLAAYSEHFLERINRIFRESEDPLLAIETYLRDVVIINITNSKTRGCLLIKTLLDLPHGDERAQSYVNDFFSEIEKLLRAALQEARQKNLTRVEPDQFSRFIVTTIFGAHSYYKSNQNTELLENNFNYLLKLLHEGGE